MFTIKVIKSYISTIYLVVYAQLFNIIPNS